MMRGIACMAGSFKGVFVHGVLRALEDADFVAEAYAAASSSALLAAYAAIGSMNALERDMWTENARMADEPGMDMSRVMLHAIGRLSSRVREMLFRPSASRLLIATSLVATDEAAAATSEAKAARLGRRLLLSAARLDTEWVQENLQLQFFDTHASDPTRRLTKDNFEAVAYATTRMLHAWPIPAFVNKRQYVDASYTCLCPAVELASLGYDVVAIATEPGPIRRNLFTAAIVPKEWDGREITRVCPEGDLRDLGVDYLRATPEGLQRAFDHGMDRGQAFLRGLRS
jgi:hypothetical protein